MEKVGFIIMKAGWKLMGSNFTEVDPSVDISYAQLERNTGQTFSPGWTSISFDTLTIGDGITYMEDSINFSKVGHYRITVGFRVGNSSDQWTGVRVYGGGIDRGHSNGFGTISTSSAQFQSSFLVDIPDVSLPYYIQIGRNNTSLSIASALYGSTVCVTIEKVN